jgi:twitching motility two-component system response regulator PilH
MSIFSFLRRSPEPSKPAAVPVPKEPADRRRLSRLRARSGTKVLVIDDSQTVVVALTRMLKQNHYDTLFAYDAETGISLARARKPHLIFLDIILPGMNGFNALRALRRDSATQNIPVIMISGNDQAAEQYYAERIGADDFMKKPFNRVEVFSRIDRLLGPDLLPHRPAAKASEI